jgi:hypothetical protein
MLGDPIDDDDEKAPGGLGDRSAPPAMTTGTRDVRLTALALEERWPLSPEAKAAAVRRLEDVVSNPASGPRAFASALKALTALSRLNLAAVDVTLKAKAQEELEERVAAVEQRLEQQKLQGGA